MRLLSKVAIGGGAASAVTAGVLVTAGVFATSATLVAVDPGAQPAQADGLAAFDDCADLLDWYVENNISEVGPYGWGGPIVYMTKELNGGAFLRAPQALTDAAAAPRNSLDARTSSSTGTNTQEIDVDEPDVAKTDGKLLVRLTKPRHNNTDQMLAVSDVTGAEKYTLGRLHLPETSYDSQLLLVGDHVVVTQSVTGYGNPIAYDQRMYGYAPNEPASTRVLTIDVSDPVHPTLERTDVYSGSLISARQYGDTVRLVTDTGRPELKWWTPGANQVSSDIATAHNKKVVRESTIEDWLPSVESDGKSKALLDCSDVLRPKVWSGSDTLAVTTFKADEPTDRSAVGIVAAGGLVYSSADRLYVASNKWLHPHLQGFASRRVPRPRIAPDSATTDLHAFKLTDDGTTYVGSGHINGSIRDRWSLDEYDGNLRVAWSTQRRRGGMQNGVSVLTERDGRLVEVGTLDGLGVDEDIQSVRWFDDLAIVVTFRQMDPLYTIDLSAPNHPRLLGALKIPGYSGYLHPIGDNLLLGLGVDGGFGFNGGQAAVFDISDRTHPKQVSKVAFGNSYLQALDDPRAFTWLPGKSTGVTPIADWSARPGAGRLQVVALRVDKDGDLHTRTIAQLDEGWQPRMLPLDGERLAVVDGDQVQLIDLG